MTVAKDEDLKSRVQLYLDNHKASNALTKMEWDQENYRFKDDYARLMRNLINQ